jgi:hypothetical protein
MSQISDRLLGDLIDAVKDIAYLIGGIAKGRGRGGS